MRTLQVSKCSSCKKTSLTLLFLPPGKAWAPASVPSAGRRWQGGRQTWRRFSGWSSIWKSNLYALILNKPQSVILLCQEFPLRSTGCLCYTNDAWYWRIKFRYIQMYREAKLIEVPYGSGNLKFSTDSLRRITFQNVCQTAAATVWSKKAQVQICNAITSAQNGNLGNIFCLQFLYFRYIDRIYW